MSISTAMDIATREGTGPSPTTAAASSNEVDLERARWMTWSRSYHLGMMCHRRLVPYLLVASVLIATLARGWRPPESTAAQASSVATPGVATDSGRYLPAAEAIGAGWVLVATGTPEADPAVFVDAASAVYVGPGGARVVVMVWTNLPGRAGLQRSWEAVGAISADLRFEVTGPKDGDREEELAALPLPEGCVDARRIDGPDPLYGLPGAITQCTVDPDVNVLAIVSGTIDGRSGYEASDRVATLAAEAGRR